jgi:hypothetical protein
MLTLPASVRVFVAGGATDLRRSFDRLSAQVQEVLRQDSGAEAAARKTRFERETCVAHGFPPI